LSGSVSSTLVVARRAVVIYATTNGWRDGLPFAIGMAHIEILKIGRGPGGTNRDVAWFLIARPHACR